MTATDALAAGATLATHPKGHRLVVYYLEGQAYSALYLAGDFVRPNPGGGWAVSKVDGDRVYHVPVTTAQLRELAAVAPGPSDPPIVPFQSGLLDGNLDEDPETLLFDVLEFLVEYVAFPSLEAARAVTLWAAHTHFVGHLETTPRLAALSPEKGSGKTRLLECLETVCAVSREAVNVSAAAMFRMVSTIRPTLLFDEADTFFGPKAKDNEELRGLINSGHRRGAKAWRCVGDPKNMRVEEFPSFCPVALAGIGDLPDTILDRAVLIRMRRRRTDEKVRAFRHRQAAPAGKALHDRLAGWARNAGQTVGVSEPAMPPELADRPADVWEPLIAIADAAGGIWPEWARESAVRLNAERQAADPSFGVRLLADLRSVFADDERLATVVILERLNNLEEAPWGDMPRTHRPLDARGLSSRLRRYDVRPKPMRLLDGQVVKGYDRAELADAWARYLPSAETGVTSVTTATTQVSEASPVTEQLQATDDASVTSNDAVTYDEPLTSVVADVTDVTDNQPRAGNGS